MLYELEDTSKVKHLFEGWDETLIYSCLQKVMGKIFVTDPDFPVSAMAYVGCFATIIIPISGLSFRAMETGNTWQSGVSA